MSKRGCLCFRWITTEQRRTETLPRQRIPLSLKRWVSDWFAECERSDGILWSNVVIVIDSDPKCDDSGEGDSCHWEGPRLCACGVVADCGTGEQDDQDDVGEVELKMDIRPVYLSIQDSEKVSHIQNEDQITFSNQTYICCRSSIQVTWATEKSFWQFAFFLSFLIFHSNLIGNCQCCYVCALKPKKVSHRKVWQRPSGDLRIFATTLVNRLNDPPTFFLGSINCKTLSLMPIHLGCSI